MKKQFNMENKYYTPTIEDFCFGFEYQIKCYETDAYLKKWVDFNNIINLEEKDNSFYKSLSEFKFQLNNGNIRVKHLDREDIESLGFQFTNVIELINDSFVEGFEKDNVVVYELNGKWIIYIEKEYDESNKITGNWADDVLFKGIIKNKSEFKKLMVQLGIIKNNEKTNEYGK